MAADMTGASRYSVAERIDRLPMTREVWRIMLLAGLAWLIESYDIGIIGNVLPSLTHQYALSTVMTGWLVIASTLGIVVAVIPSGWIADHIGRKRVLVVGTAWYAVFSLLCGFAPNVEALVALRFIAGFGMGAVFPIPYAMAAEYMPRRMRGAMTGVLDSFLSAGYFLAPLLAFLLIPSLSLSLGWRALFWIGGAPLLYVPALIRWMPESARWRQSRGEMREADRLVRSLETAIERRTGRPLPEPAPAEPVVVSPRRAPVSLLFRGPFLARTVMMWIAFPCVLFVFYAVQTYTPTVLVKEGYALGSAFLMTALIVVVSIPGKYLEAYLVERYGRKATIISFTVIAALSAALFGYTHSMATALIFGMLLSFFGIGVDPAIKIYGAEQYPTYVRETGIGFIEGIGRLLGGARAPFIMAFVLDSQGAPATYLFVAAVALVGAAAVGFLGTETRGQSIEHVKAVSAVAALHLQPSPEPLSA